MSSRDAHIKLDARAATDALSPSWDRPNAKWQGRHQIQRDRVRQEVKEGLQLPSRTRKGKR